MPVATAGSSQDAAVGAAVGAREPLASMLQDALEVMRGAFVDAASYSAALSLLYKYCANILSNPSEDKFRVIKKSNARFQNAIGQHAAARQVLRAVGFVEISAGAAQEASFTLPAFAELSKLTLLMTLMTPVMAALTVATTAPPAPVDEPPMADAALLQEALEVMRGAFVDAASYSAALSLLYKYCANILSNPSEDKFRVIKKSNARFQNAIGQHAAARQVLRAVGFVEISAGAAQEASFTLPAFAELSKLTLLMTLMTPVMAALTVATTAPPAPVVGPMADAALLDADADAAAAAAAAARAPPPPSSSLTTARLEEPPSASQLLTTARLEEPPSASQLLTTARLEEPPSASQLRASTGGMTLTEAHVATLRRQKLLPRPELSVPRQLLVLRPGEGVAAPPPELKEELPEDYFELTANDVSAMSLAGAPGGAARYGAAMQTKAMRELRQLEAMKEYSHALIRVRLPASLSEWPLNCL